MARGEWDFDCAVIGGGPGGLVSALYLRRFRRSVALINSGKPRAAWIPRTHNLLGFPQGIAGTTLLSRLNRQVNTLGAERVRAQARVKRARGGFAIECGGYELKARTVILATGVDDVQPEISNLIELRRAGLLRYCSVCDAYDHRDMTLGVLANDDYGVQKGLFLRTYSHDLHLIVPENLRLSPRRLAQIRDCRMHVHPGNILAIDRTSSPKGLEIILDRGKPIWVQAAYVELGCKVRDWAFQGLKGIHRTKQGFITTTTESRAGIPGLFAVGDCVNLLAQISVAAGQAAVAATTIHNDLSDY